nr:cytochrome P450 2C15-like isoform X1 [Cherax quadricarinatus]
MIAEGVLTAETLRDMALEWMGKMPGWESIVLLGLLLFLLLIFVAPGRRPPNFPPGLPMWPVIGSMLHIQGLPLRTVLRNLRKEYGNMASFGVFGTGVLLVSDFSLIKEIFSHKASRDRPPMSFTTTRNYLLSDGQESNLGIIGGNGDKWQELRRFVLRHLRDFGFGKTTCEPMITKEVTELMDHIQQQKGQPIPMMRLFNLSVVNTLWGMVMGKRFAFDDAKVNKLLETFLEPARASNFHPIFFIPGMSKAVIYLPILRHTTKSLERIVRFVKEEVDNFISNEDCDVTHSFASIFLKEMQRHVGEKSIFNMHEFTAVIFDMFAAGMDTTSSTLTMGVYLIAKHPAIQQKVQQELDEVLGRDRLPSYSDADALPYTLATIHEVQRYFCFTAVATHSASEDCKFAGYDIPKGTVLLENIEAAMTDPKLWKNPQEFDPENFLNADGKYVKNPAFIPYGIGTRVCAGEPQARMQVFLFLSCLFQRFTFSIVGEEILFNSPTNFNAPAIYSTVAHPRPPL